MKTLLATFAAAVLACPLAAQTQKPMGPPQTDKGSMAPASEEISVPQGERWLGTVRIPVRVLANGEPLPAGSYRVRLTGRIAETKAVGQLAELERWVEFVQGGEVRGRAMAPLVPSGAVKQVAESAPPAAGRFRVERLKGDDYLRVWYNFKGDQVLIYLPIQKAAS